MNADVEITYKSSRGLRDALTIIATAWTIPGFFTIPEVVEFLRTFAPSLRLR